MKFIEMICWSLITVCIFVALIFGIEYMRFDEEKEIMKKIESFKKFEIGITTVADVDDVFGKPRTGFMDQAPVEYHNYSESRRYYSYNSVKGFRVECEFDNHGILQRKFLQDLK